MVASAGTAEPPGTDRADCAQEAIHVPGAVQPHGVLIVLEPCDMTVVWVSSNATSMLALAPEELLGRRLAEITEIHDGLELAVNLSRERVEEGNPFVLRLVSGATFQACAHRHDNRIILECEQDTDPAQFRQPHFDNRVRSSLVRLRATSSLQHLCEQAAHEMRGLTGFDRVVIYAFKPDWSGEVVAEAYSGTLDRYHGLRFPASDIPSQARALYAACHLRVIPSSTYRAAELVGLAGQRRVDLTYAALRSISPTHLEYMRNMGVTASMGLSLMDDDQLWGLISCNHESGARFVPFRARFACAWLGEVVSSMIGQRRRIDESERRIDYLDTQAKLLQHIAQEKDVVRGLTEHVPSLLDVTKSAGAALYYNKELHTLGKTPSTAELGELIAWLENQGQSSVTAESLPARFPAASAYKDVGCGLAAELISVGDGSVITQRHWLLWFRPEASQTIDWGGDPNKPQNAASGDTLRPRASFRLWKEAVELKSLPFSDAELAAARSLGNALTEVILEQEAIRKLKQTALLLEQSHSRLLEEVVVRQAAEQAALLAREMATEASALKSRFLANMSHEIRTPMNGVLGMLKLCLGTSVSEEQLDYLTLAHRSADNLLELINDILDLSKIEAGKLELESLEFVLEQVVQDACLVVRQRAHEKKLNLVVDLDPTLPRTLVSDPTRLRQVLINLLGNAIKFTERGQVIARLWAAGSALAPELEVSVTDTGIGIPKARQTAVFGAFAQADQSTTRKYGGTGLGLSIASQLVDAMGGSLRVHSESGAGTTFLFRVPLVTGVDSEPPHRSDPLVGTVLLIGEPVESREIVGRMLRTLGLSVHATDRLESALPLAKELKQALAFVLLNCPDETAAVLDPLALAYQRGELGAARCYLLLTGDALARAFLESHRISGAIAKPLLPSTLARVLSGSAVSEQAPAAPESLTPARTLDVLVAEDQPINARLIMSLLERGGHRATHVTNGALALTALAAAHFDVVLMDVQMPVMDGLDAVRRLREREAEGAQRTTVIALTANAMKGDREACLEAGMDGYVTKPIDPKLLQRAFQSLVIAPGQPRVEIAYDKETRKENDAAFDRDELLERVCQDQTFFTEMIQVFLDNSAHMFADLEQSIRGSDDTQVHAAAHRLKGALQIVAARRAAPTAQALELAARDHLRESYNPTLARLRDELTELTATLRHELER